MEAQVPLDRSAGTGFGVIAQFYIFLDDLYPNSIGSQCWNGSIERLSHRPRA